MWHGVFYAFNCASRISIFRPPSRFPFYRLRLCFVVEILKRMKFKCSQFQFRRFSVVTFLQEARFLTWLKLTPNFLSSPTTLGSLAFRDFPCS